MHGYPPRHVCAVDVRWHVWRVSLPSLLRWRRGQQRRRVGRSWPAGGVAAASQRDRSPRQKMVGAAAASVGTSKLGKPPIHPHRYYRRQLGRCSCPLRSRRRPLAPCQAPCQHRVAPCRYGAATREAARRSSREAAWAGACLSDRLRRPLSSRCGWVRWRSGWARRSTRPRGRPAGRSSWA